MHLLVPFASDTSEACRHVLRDLALPNLERLLALLAPTGRDDGDALDASRRRTSARSPPPGAGRAATACLPFAARAAAADGIATGESRLGAAHAGALAARPRPRDLCRPGDLLELAEAESRALFDAARGLFESEGFGVAWGSAGRWYAARDDLDGLATRLARPRHRPQRRSLAARGGARPRRERGRPARAPPAERGAARLPHPRRQRGARASAARSPSIRSG